MGDAMFARPSVRAVLARLASDGALAPDAEARAREAVLAMERARTPWYLSLLIGIGAWAGAGFLLSFAIGMIALAIGDTRGVSLVLGVLTMGAAIALRHLVANSAFGRHVALVMSFTGQALVIGGVGESLRSVVAASVAAILVSAVLIVTFPDRVQRFSSTVIAAGAVLTIIISEHISFGMDALALTLAIAPIVLWRVMPRVSSDEVERIVEPVVYGLAIALFGVLLFDTLTKIFGVFRTDAWRSGIGLATTVGFAAAVIWLVSGILADHHRDRYAADAMLAYLTIVLLVALTRRTPAILATILVLMLGFDHRARSLVALAAVFFVGFGGLYYYSLELTLLQKSGLLVASGVICLAAAAFVRWRFPLAPEAVSPAPVVETS